ncbi:MAG: flavin reductase, partial [Erysipelotrichales bacterium]|nr:flavin reductase [Erysipelotrichales bacterium]
SEEKEKNIIMQCTKKVLEDLIWVGADDRRLTCFEGVYGVPNGVSYNSYLMLDEKTVLFDTVDKAVAHTFFDNVAYALGGRKLDYLVVHHMEPDHAATIEDLLYRYPDTTIICNAKIKTMLGQYFDYDMSNQIKLVNEGDTMSFGKHTLTFVNAPMVHWPEVMMSYDLTDKILFTADAFGTFGALNGRIFADEVDFMHDWIDEARRYYTNIVGKYGPQVQMVLKKAAKLDIAYVCPLHGFVWRSHFNDFLNKYLDWSSYTPEVKGVCLAYASVYGHTENMANILAGKLSDRGVPVEMFDTSVIPASYIVASAFKNSHLVFAATTYNAGIFVTMENLLNDIVAHNLQNRKIALLENGSWGPMSGKLMKELLSKLKGTEFIGNTVTIKSAPKPGTMEELDALADAIAKDIVPSREEPLPAEPVTKLEVSNDAFIKFTYGVEVLTTRYGGKDYGCVINTAYQVAAGDTKKVAVSVINQNYTCEMIKKSGKFNVSVLTEEAPFSLFQQFGFQSGRDVDKFADVSYNDRLSNGIRYLPVYTNAVFSCEVLESFDLETSTLFIAKVTEAKALSNAPSCTYGYYHAHIKPKKQPAAEQKEGWRCKVCGYFYEGKELPADFVCPLCKHGPEDFEYVAPVTVQKKKGFICKVCGYFEPFEGDELPKDYVCPICKHGPEDFEPAEM